MAGESVRAPVLKRNMQVHYAVWQALRDGTWWAERQKIEENNRARKPAEK